MSAYFGQDPMRSSRSRWRRPMDREFFEYLLDLEVRKAGRHLYYFSLLAVGLDERAVEGFQEQRRFQDVLESIIREEVRGTDLIGRRSGGGTFVILHYSDLSHALLVSERVRERVSHYRFDTARSGGNRTASIGATCFPSNANDVSGLLTRTEEMLSRAQASGGDRVCVPEEQL